MKETVLINYTGRRGGGALDAYESARGFLENDIEVIAVVSNYAENLAQWRKLPVKELIAIDTYNTKCQLAFRTLKFWLKGKYEIKNRLKGIDISYIYCPMLTFWTDIINSLVDTYKFIVIHDPVPHEGEKFWMTQLLGHATIKKADCLIVHSRQFVGWVRKRYGKRTMYIPLGGHDTYKRMEEKRAVISYDDDKINFLFFGRISKETLINWPDS